MLAVLVLAGDCEDIPSLQGLPLYEMTNIFRVCVIAQIYTRNDGSRWRHIEAVEIGCSNTAGRQAIHGGKWTPRGRKFSLNITHQVGNFVPWTQVTARVRSTKRRYSTTHIQLLSRTSEARRNRGNYKSGSIVMDFALLGSGDFQSPETGQQSIPRLRRPGEAVPWIRLRVRIFWEG
jgi:hypothetical protein